MTIIITIFAEVNKVMFQHLGVELEENPKGKSIYIMQNGFPDSIFKMNYIKPITKVDIAN